MSIKEWLNERPGAKLDEAAAMRRGTNPQPERGGKTQNGSDDTVAKVLLLIAALLCWATYKGLDSVGWIPHRVDSAITAQENWFVGEAKQCISDSLDEQTAKVWNKPDGSVVEHVNCDDGPEHHVRITFWGQRKQKGIAWATWSCTRESSSFTCKQTGITQKQ